MILEVWHTVFLPSQPLDQSLKLPSKDANPTVLNRSYQGQLSQSFNAPSSFTSPRYTFTQILLATTLPSVSCNSNIAGLSANITVCPTTRETFGRCDSPPLPFLCSTVYRTTTYSGLGASKPSRACTCICVKTYCSTGYMPSLNLAPDEIAQ